MGPEVAELVRTGADAQVDALAAQAENQNRCL